MLAFGAFLLLVGQTPLAVFSLYKVKGITTRNSFALRLAKHIKMGFPPRSKNNFALKTLI
jgi:hypothetical protein